MKTSVKEKSKYTHEEVEEACREANAYDFISELPQNFATECGKKVETDCCVLWFIFCLREVICLVDRNNELQ